MAISVENIPPNGLHLIPRAEVCRRMNRGRSSTYPDIENGLLTVAVNCGVRSLAWPSYEIDAINAARIAGKSDDEIRALVKSLMKNRQKVFSNLSFLQGMSPDSEAVA